MVQMRKSKRVLVVVAHPDDEVLGCGGALARHAYGGSDISLMVLTDGVSARGKNLESAQLRSNELRESCQVLGINSIIQEDLPDNRLDSVPLLEIAQKILPILNAVKPQVIYTHYLYDLNQDHSAVSRAVRIATRPSSVTNFESILMMEVPSSTEWAFGEIQAFHPNYFVPLDQTHLNCKLEALSKYASELRNPPHPRCAEHAVISAKFRGSQIGYEYSEGFMMLRHVQSL
jgi:LmbE family N-acetylglucosaminyl deacetylase